MNNKYFMYLLLKMCCCGNFLKCLKSINNYMLIEIRLLFKGVVWNLLY